MFSALHSTSVVLGNYLRRQLESLPALMFGGGGTRQVSLNSPYEMRTQMNVEGLSVWLYRIVRDETRLNQPPRRVGLDQVLPPPLPLRLHYLLTPVTLSPRTGGAPDIEQQVMGRVLQAFHSRPTLRGIDLVASELEGTDAELNVRLESLHIDELARIWDALQGSYQLSVSYEVSLVNVEVATAPERVSPVQVVLPEYALMVEGA